MNATISNHLRQRTVNIRFSLDVIASLDSKEIVIEEIDGGLRFRSAVIMDNKRLSINEKSKKVGYTSDQAKIYIGNYEIEKEDDWFYLKRI